MKALALISGGIDSPVAAYLMKSKVKIFPLYFDNSPYSGKDTKERALDSARVLGFKKMFVIPNGHNLEEIGKKCEAKYRCVLCKRMMIRISGELAKELGMDVLITGESLAQVASQTLQNIYTESQATDIPIARPLIGFNKNEIIDIGKKIGTYDVSIKPATCCSFVPRKPSTHAVLQRILEEEKKIDIKELVEKSLKSKKELKL